MLSKVFITKYGSLFFAVALLWVILYFSFPANRSENDDGYFFAYSISHLPYSELLFPRYFLFLPIMKCYYDLGKIAFPGLDAYNMMCMLSSLFASLTVLLLFRLLVKKMGASRHIAFFACLLLLGSYGFWRYSVEAEVYMLNFLLLLVAFYFLQPASGQMQNPSTGNILIAALVAALAAMVYKPDIIVVGVAYTWPMLIKKQWKVLGVYLLAMLVCLGIGYFLAYQIQPRNFESFGAYLLGGSSQQKGSAFLSVLVVAANLVSINFVYGIPSFANLVATYFPNHIIAEEIFAARHLHTLSVIACGTLVLVVGLWSFIFYKSLAQVDWKKLWSNPFVVWMVAYSVMLLILDPNSPEAWLMILLPLIILFATFFGEAYQKLYGMRALWLLAFALVLHNVLGGYLFIRSKQSDYLLYQGGWLLKNAKPNDLIISMGSGSFIRYLMYHSATPVCVPEQQFDTCMLRIKSTLGSGGKVFLLNDMLQPSVAVANRDKQAFEKVQAFVQKNKSQIVRVNMGNEKEAIVYQLLATTP